MLCSVCHDCCCSIVAGRSSRQILRPMGAAAVVYCCVLGTTMSMAAGAQCGRWVQLHAVGAR